MPDYSIILMIPLLPLTAFIMLGLFGRDHFRGYSGIVAIGLILISAILSLYTAFNYFFVYGKANGAYHYIQIMKYTWLQFSPGVSIDMVIALDPIAVMMLVVVSLVSLMVNIFSQEYMKGEKRLATYYSFISLFTFSMIGLVLSGNIFQIYIFWELVGVSSYLLIGFYFDKPAAVAASKKAFIVTRFADLGFLIGILILAFQAESLDLNILIQRLTSTSPQLLSILTSSFLGVSLLTWSLSLIFIGGAGKSAMFPLHIWLPDAMEGPTPVSALIHAATMVVAGVYLVARLFPIFGISDPGALKLVMYTGALSALFAAIIACAQTDIKRVLAYSTMSQIGYMMFAMGVSKYGGEAGLGYMASMFHLFTHAFFKSLLFLSAGMIIHAFRSNEINNMGGLRKIMPVTHISFLVACLAIAGIPPFSGFFSKEEILLAAYQSNKWVYWIGLFTSGLTAFYMFRLYFSVFWNKEKNLPAIHKEGTAYMKIPLVILSICTVLAGFVPFSELVTSDGFPLKTQLNFTFSVLPLSFASLGIFFAAYLYREENQRPEKIAYFLGGWYRAAYRKFYIDEMYLFTTKKIIFPLIGRPVAWMDKKIVDGFMNELASLFGKISERIKGLQSGKIQNYTIYFFAGIGGLVVIFIYWLK